MVVGRDLRADVRIAHPLISRAHLLLRFDHNRWVAIDNGSNSGCPPLDGRGFARPFDGDLNGINACDVGVVEFRPQVMLRDGFESSTQ